MLGLSNSEEQLSNETGFSDRCNDLSSYIATEGEQTIKVIILNLETEMRDRVTSLTNARSDTKEICKCTQSVRVALWQVTSHIVKRTVTTAPG